MFTQRKSGVLLHPTSLPGHYGVGTLNQAAYRWVDWLEKAGQSLWQVLPLGPTGYGDSPYQSFSSFAGNPYLISLETVVRDGLLRQDVLDNAPTFPVDKVDYGAIYQWKLPLLRQVADEFYQRAVPDLQDDFERFCKENQGWLDDFSLFMALKDDHDGKPWNQWPMALRSRQPGAIAKATQSLADAIHGYKCNQWLFYRQWRLLKSYANAKGIQIVGDIPIFVAMDSADAWTNPDEFYLDEAYQPTHVAGVPPDYFSVTGQLWGNPLYDWPKMAQNGYAWWVQRIQSALQLYDIVRIDHFRGFAGYWEVPADEKTAINGQWVNGPGADFFEVIQNTLGDLPIIAEDLGDITEEVIELRDRFNLPGMKILQFAFSSDASDKFLPHNYNPNFIVYTGTHDNDTSIGWYEQSSEEKERDLFRQYLRTDGHDPAWSMIDAALRSVACTAIVPLQDILNLGTEARMNYPGRAEGNWSWRFTEEQLTDWEQSRLRSATEVYGRYSENYKE